MSIGLRRPWDAVDFDELARLFPPPPGVLREGLVRPAREIDRVKLVRARHRADRAGRVPFFRRLWDEPASTPGT